MRENMMEKISVLNPFPTFQVQIGFQNIDLDLAQR